ncbi:MAG: metallophosphoesterase family protein [Candidatus Aenigmarchaeota archaeon]|nr:metallophosphoesterase family protein [Candidatus Aenigmarchaeota archaeon]
MDKAEIVRHYFGRGQLLTPAALDEMAAAGRMPETDSALLVIDRSDLERDNIRILKCLQDRPKEVDTDMFLKFYTSKYNKMRDIFTSRFSKNFISLNKVDASRSEIAVFGIVKDVKDKTVELEDMTSSVSVVFETPLEKVERDDAVAVEGISGGKVIYGKKIMFADVPLRQPAIGTGKACFISDLRLSEAPRKDAEKFFSWFQNQDIRNLFISGDTGDIAALEAIVRRHCSGKNIFLAPGEADDKEYPRLPMKAEGVTALSDPAMVEINGIKILVAHNFDIAMLRKRYLGRSKSILPEDYLVLEDVPDIVHCGHTGKPFVQNYKAITVVNSGSLLDEFKPVVIDFATREVKQVSL